MKNNLSEQTCPICGALRNISINTSQMKMRQKAAKALANHLSFTLQIPPRRELVNIIGHGSEHNNQEAIASWVMDRISNIHQWPLPSEDVSELITQLEQDLIVMLSDMRLGIPHV